MIFHKFISIRSVRGGGGGVEIRGRSPRFSTFCEGPSRPVKVSKLITNDHNYFQSYD